MAVQNEGAKREIASSSGDESQAPAVQGITEVVVVFEAPTSAEPEIVEQPAEQQTSEITPAEVCPFLNLAASEP